MLTLKNVKKDYQDFRLDCSLTLQKGEIVGLVGRNGAGKSTAFKIALGLVTHEGGTVELFEKPIHKVTAKDRQRLGVSLADSSFNEFFSIKEIISMLKNFYPQFEKAFFWRNALNFSCL